MCKYCETLPNVNFCESIANTGFDNCAIIYDSNNVAYIGLSCDEFETSEPISYCPFCGRNLNINISLFEDTCTQYDMDFNNKMVKCLCKTKTSVNKNILINVNVDPFDVKSNSLFDTRKCKINLFGNGFHD